MVSFVVYGIPAPQGSKKFVGMKVSKKTGREFGAMAEMSKGVAPWRKRVEAAAAAAKAETLDGPLAARLIFTMPKPKSAPKRRQTWPDRTPDLSKLVRSTEDAIVSAGLIADDARIVEYTRVAKVFPGEDPESLPMPGVRVTIGTIRNVD